MKIVIEIPDKTNAHIRSDYGHCVTCLRESDMDIICDAIYNCIPYEERPHGEWRDFSNDGYVECPFCEHATNCDDNIKELHYCFYCGAALRPREREAK